MFNCNLNDALYINTIDEAENERPAINNVIATHFSHADTNHILVNSEQIKTMISQLIKMRFPEPDSIIEIDNDKLTNFVYNLRLSMFFCQLLRIQSINTDKG